MVAPLFMVMLASAIRLPWNWVPVPSVAELPTCQYTAHGCAPAATTTCALVAVVSVLPIWNMKTPVPVSVRMPVNWAEGLNVYTPDGKVIPPRSWPVKLDVDGAPAASPYAVARSLFACTAGASPMCWVPVITPGGNPVTNEPGLRPRLPLITVLPVLVIVDAARMAKLTAVPSLGSGAAIARTGHAPSIPPAIAIERKTLPYAFRPTRRSTLLVAVPSPIFLQLAHRTRAPIRTDVLCTRRIHGWDRRPPRSVGVMV